MSDTNKNKAGFTIVELLIVIVVIGILAALVLNSFAGAQEKARIASAEQGVAALIKGIKKLEADTGKKAFGCPPGGGVFDAEGQVNLAIAGIMTAPSGTWDGNCGWTAADAANWRGPYLNSSMDPWGTNYIVDNDYGICRDGVYTYISAALSAGPNKAINYPSNPSTPCTVIASDDIYRQIR